MLPVWKSLKETQTTLAYHPHTIFIKLAVLTINWELKTIFGHHCILILVFPSTLIWSCPPLAMPRTQCGITPWRGIRWRGMPPLPCHKYGITWYGASCYQWCGIQRLSLVWYDVSYGAVWSPCHTLTNTQWVYCNLHFGVQRSPCYECALREFLCPIGPCPDSPAYGIH